MKTDALDKQYKERVQKARKIKYIYDMWKKFVDFQNNEKELEENWFKEQYTSQKSNLYAANSIPFKKRSISMGERKEPPANEEIDLLAETEHNRWNIERLLLGYKPYKIAEREESRLNGDKNIDIYFNKAKLLIHKDITPYKELINIKGNVEEEDTKEIDRRSVRTILTVI